MGMIRGTEEWFRFIGDGRSFERLAVKEDHDGAGKECRRALDPFLNRPEMSAAVKESGWPGDLALRFFKKFHKRRTGLSSFASSMPSPFLS